ncbi:MAG: hypothetical protein F6K09_37440 [Merismopedia sp. SIO2A8]|nr:hypothetical protein [Symploca sp. SIO2B6]NET54102.1 hypothetical protein [Merismopedia sp. SIO2A8]
MPDFKSMPTPQLKTYVLGHRSDVEAVRELFRRRSPDSQATIYPAPLSEETRRQTQNAIEERISRNSDFG